MKVLIAGSRDLENCDKLVKEAVKASGFVLSVVISGGARGIDRAGERFSESVGLPCRVFKADWSKGKVAGFLRNTEMVEKADALIAIWDGQSNGTWDTITKMCRKGGHIYIHKVES